MAATRPRLLPFRPHVPARRERRGSARYAPLDGRLWLGRWAGPAQFEVIAVTLRDLSRTGAAVLAPGPLTDGEEVWLCSEGAAGREVAPAVVVGGEPAGPVTYVVRLAFAGTCPRSIYDRALGIDPGPGVPPRRPVSRPASARPAPSRRPVAP